jgi:hypothetical protein
MSGLRTCKWLLGAAVAVVALGNGRSALAHGEDKEKADRPSPSTGGSAEGTVGASGATGDAVIGADHPQEESSEGEEKEKGISIGLDMVLGFGDVTIANQSLPGSNGVTPVSSINNSQVSTESFILSGGYELGKVGLGLRLPFALGQLNPDGFQSRGGSAVGNLELSGEYGFNLNEQLKLIGELGVTLPTAQGSEVPDDVSKLATNSSTGLIDQNAYDRFSLNHAAASSRGFEDNALFEPQRFGLIPKIVLRYHTRQGLTIEPYVKLENLMDTSGHADQGYVGELVPALRAAYRVAKHLEPGLRVWGNVPISGGGLKAVGVLEPELRIPFEHVTPMVGVIIPFAGPLTSPEFVGVQAAVAANF